MHSFSWQSAEISVVAKSIGSKFMFPVAGLFIASVFLDPYLWGQKLNVGATSEAVGQLEEQVKEIFTENCTFCHGNKNDPGYVPGKSLVYGDIDYITDLDRLIDEGIAFPGLPELSELFLRVASDDPLYRMPQDDDPLSREEIAIIEQWILTLGALQNQRPSIDPISLAEVLVAIEDDSYFDVFPERVRYFSFAHLHNAGKSEKEIRAMVNDLSFLINSLRWDSYVEKLEVVDESLYLYRFNLLDGEDDHARWLALENSHPYSKFLKGFLHQTLTERFATHNYLYYGDWFLATASKPPFYHDLLELPTEAGPLLKTLNVDILNTLSDIDYFAPYGYYRAGFLNSGVSNFNRIIERFDARYGYYWHSYDFGSNLGRKNIFENPIGPFKDLGIIESSGEQLAFEHDGGEVIFSLPNGLQGYLLTDNAGNRLDVGPENIVYDRVRDSEIINGISCMFCHADGLLQEKDEIRAFAEKDQIQFSSDAKRRIFDFYSGNDAMERVIREDSQKYLRAVEKSFVYPESSDGVTIIKHFDQYNEPVDIALMEHYLFFAEDTLARFAAKTIPGRPLSDFLQQMQNDPEKTLRRVNFETLIVELFGDKTTKLKD